MLFADSAHFRSIYSGGDGYSAKIGKMAFQVNNSLKIHEDSCLDSGGCICGRNEQEINIVCSLVKCIDENVKCLGKFLFEIKSDNLTFCTVFS